MQRYFVAGHSGMVGSAILRKLHDRGFDPILRSHISLDLVNQGAVQKFFETEKPDVVILAAARVGGIHANNTYPAEFIYQNLMIEANVIHAAFLSNVKKLLFLGSSCIYPRDAKQPMAEGLLLTGHLEKTNEPYAIAKIAGIKLCESYNRQYGTDFRSVMPTNLYGPGDNFHPENSHVVSALIRRFHEAVMQNTAKVTIWGTGTPRREFLHVDDMADACLHVLDLDREVYESNYDPMVSHINIGSSVDISISELAQMIAKITNFKGQILFDRSKPDGTPRKLLDVSRLSSLGWSSKIKLEDGLRSTYEWFKEANSNMRA